MMKSVFRITLLLSIYFLGNSCRAFYHNDSKFSHAFYNGNYEKASEVLSSKKRAETNKNRLLYFYNQGIVQHLAGNFEESNHYFEKAILYYETESKKIGSHLLGVFTNPKTSPYFGEPHEHLLVHYYKTINYLQLGDYEAALVECRRLNNQQNVLNTEMKHKNKYRDDAFIHNMMGIIYHALKDYNNAFIAYRNALNAYQIYDSVFKLPAPVQLKKDLLFTAVASSFSSEYEFYSKKFNMKYDARQTSNEGEMVYLFHHGIAPFKTQQSINLIANRQNGELFFINKEMGISIPIPRKEQEKEGVNNIQMLRMALPKYVSRPNYAVYPVLFFNNESQGHPLEAAQDIEKIAFQTLKDRIGSEIGNAVLRLLLKKSTEYALKNENQTAGNLLTVANFISEQADTRNWNTLPKIIYYTRINKPAGTYQLTLANNNPNTPLLQHQVEIKAKRTTFVIDRKL